MFFSLSIQCIQSASNLLSGVVNDYNHSTSSAAVVVADTRSYELQRYYGIQNTLLLSQIHHNLSSIIPLGNTNKYTSEPSSPMCLFVYKCLICSTTKLKHHMYRRPSIDTIGFQWPIIRKLFPRKDETDLIYLNPLLFLKCLLYGKDLIFGFEVEGLLTAC